MMVGASMSDNELIQSTLSVSTVQRSMKKFAVTASESIISNKLAIPSAYYTLHWDGKIFKSLTHCGKNKERVAVLLTASNGEEILLGIFLVFTSISNTKYALRYIGLATGLLQAVVIKYLSC